MAQDTTIPVPLTSGTTDNPDAVQSGAVAPPPLPSGFQRVGQAATPPPLPSGFQRAGQAPQGTARKAPVTKPAPVAKPSAPYAGVVGGQEQDAVENFLDNNAATGQGVSTAGKALYQGAKGLYHGLMGDQESAQSKGTTSTTAAPNPVHNIPVIGPVSVPTSSPSGAANLGLNPEHLGYTLGNYGRMGYDFIKGFTQDATGIGTKDGKALPVIIPDQPNTPNDQLKRSVTMQTERNTGWADPNAQTLVGKYINAPSAQEREASAREMEEFAKTHGWEATGHAISALIHGTLGEYIPMIGPLVGDIMDTGARGDVGGALSKVAALYAAEETTGAAKDAIKARVDPYLDTLKDKLKHPEVRTTEANEKALAEPRAKAQARYDAAKAKYDAYSASHEQGVQAPEKVVKELEKAKAELDEATFHHESAQDKLKSAQERNTIPQRVGRAAGQAVARVMPKEAPPEVPITAAPAPELQPLGQEQAKMPKLGEPQAPPSVSPAHATTTIPQEPTAAPRTPVSPVTLPGGEPVGKIKLLGEGTPIGPQVPAEGLPQIKQEVLPPEKPKKAAKPERGRLGELTVDETGKVVEKDPQGAHLQRLLEESLKNTKGNENFPAATVEPETKETPAAEASPEEKRKGEDRRHEEVPVEEERRVGPRRNPAGIRVDEHGNPVLSPDVEGHWQSSVFGEKPVEDIGAKAREANPEPTRAETKKTAEETRSIAVPKEEKPKEVLYRGVNADEARKIEETGRITPDVFSSGHVTPDRSTAEAYAKANGGKVYSIDTNDIKPEDLAHYRETGRGPITLSSEVPTVEHKGRTAVPKDGKIGARFNGKEINKYIDAIHDPDEEYGTKENEPVSNLDPKTTYELKYVSTKNLKPMWGVDEDKVKKYANTVSDFPPVVLDANGEVNDGGHRVAAAKLRGDATIKAYVPTGEKPVLPNAEPTRYEAAKEPVMDRGEEGREQPKSAAEYHPAVRQKVYELSNVDLDKLAEAHGLNPKAPEYSRSKEMRNEGRHQVGRQKLADDITAQMDDEEKINIGRAAEAAEKEPGFASQDQSGKAKAARARELFPRLREEGPGGATETGYGSKNTGVTKEQYEAARKAAQKKLGGTLGSTGGNIPWEEWKTQAKYHLEALGNEAADFADWSKKMVASAGESVKPHLQKLWDETQAEKPVDIKKVVSEYNKKNGLGEVDATKHDVDPRRKEIAEAYDAMKHDPKNPEVKKAYDALIADAKKQWDALEAAGIKIEPTDEDPYKSYEEMKKDFEENKRLKVFRGGNELPADHPLAQVDPKTGETYNVMFRAVHDAIGHLHGDNDFSEKGEENAFRTHRQTMSKDAVPAMTTETKGQVASFFEGGNEFPDQKAGILPERFNEDSPDAKSVLDHIKSGKDFALLTAENPNNERASAEDNAKRNSEMKADLEKMGYKPVPIEGHNADVEGEKENSFFVPDIKPEDAAKISKKYGQASVMTKEGIHDLKKDTVHPAGKMIEGDEAAKQDYHSTVGGEPFSIPVDFDKEVSKTANAPFPEKVEHPTVETPKGGKKLPTNDQLVKKYGETQTTDPKHVVMILDDGRQVPNSGTDHDVMLGGKATDKNPPRERWVQGGGVRIREYQGTQGRKIGISIPENGVNAAQWERLSKMAPQLSAGTVMLEVGKVGGKYEVIPYGEASAERLESAIKNITGGSEKPQSVGSARAGTSLAKEKPLTPEQLQERLPDIAQKHLTDEEKTSLTTDKKGRANEGVVSKFVKNMLDIPSVQEYIDIAKLGEGARKWYKRSSQAFDALKEAAPKYFGEAGDKDKFTGMLAGSSPQQAVVSNLRETLGLWKAWVDAGRPKLDIAKWKEFNDLADKAWEDDGSPRVRGMAKGASMHWDYAPTGPEWKNERMLLENLTLPNTKVPNIIKALNGEHLWPDITKNKAFKAPSFAENLRKWLDGAKRLTSNVTNDSWMGLFGGVDKKALTNPESYHPLSVATRAAAEALGWDPEEAQAAIWSFTQALTEKGTEDPEVVRHYSEDFADILQHDNEVRSLLEDLGVNKDDIDARLKQIEAKPEITSRPSATSEDSVRKLRDRIETARGKNAIPEPKSIQGNLFRENPSFEHRVKPGEGHTRTAPSELELIKQEEQAQADRERIKAEQAKSKELGTVKGDLFEGEEGPDDFDTDELRQLGEKKKPGLKRIK